jgi:hypothetical protein
VSGATVFTFDDEGMIKEEHRYFDGPTLGSQLDAKAKAGSFRPVASLPTGATEYHVVKGTPEEKKTLDDGLALYTAFESHKVDEMMKWVGDTTTMDDYSMPGPAMTGPKQMKEVISAYYTTFPDLAQTKQVQFAVDGFVITEGTFTGTQKGAMGPIKATNKPVTLHFVDVFQIKDAKIVKALTYSNSYEMLVAVGAAPPPGAPPAASAAPQATGASPGSAPAAKKP